MEQRQLSIMRSVRNQLMFIPPKEQTPEYANIYKAVQAYLQNECEHNIVEDMIDIHPECSQTIYYCEYCETTFDYKSYANAKNK